MERLTKSNSRFVNAFFTVSLGIVFSLAALRIITALGQGEDVLSSLGYSLIMLSIWFLSLIIYRIVKWK